jgi:hypothetical protein
MVFLSRLPVGPVLPFVKVPSEVSVLAMTTHNNNHTPTDPKLYDDPCFSIPADAFLEVDPNLPIELVHPRLRDAVIRARAQQASSQPALPGGDWLPASKIVQIRPIGRTTLWAWAKEGYIRKVSLVNRGNVRGRSLFSLSSIDNYIASHEVTPKKLRIPASAA